MRLIHYSENPLTEIYSVSEERQSLNPFKPVGLWVSVEGQYDWVWWCKSEKFRLDDLSFATEIILFETANILYLTNEEEIDSFTEEYGIYQEFLGQRFALNINWLLLTKKYQGIIISPYLWERRLSIHSHWYYAWDCASGAIWNKEAIKEIKAIEPPNLDIEDDEDELLMIDCG